MNCFKPLVKYIRKENLFDGAHFTKLHFEKISSRMTSAINVYRAEQPTAVMAHTAHSPDLSLSDYGVYDFLKQWL